MQTSSGSLAEIETQWSGTTIAAVSPPGAEDLGSNDPESRALRTLERGEAEAALSVLMDAYGDSLYRYCLGIVREPELAEDVHQMTFVQAYESLAGFAGRSSLRTWLYGIARHRCLDALKMKRRRERRIELVETLPETPLDGGDGGDGPESRLVARSLAQALDHCLGKLKPRVRQAILLRFQEGFSYAEMSRICNEQPATLQARVARALPVLRRSLESQGVCL